MRNVKGHAKRVELLFRASYAAPFLFLLIAQLPARPNAVKSLTKSVSRNGKRHTEMNEMPTIAKNINKRNKTKAEANPRLFHFMIDKSWGYWSCTSLYFCPIYPVHRVCAYIARLRPDFTGWINPVSSLTRAAHRMLAACAGSPCVIIHSQACLCPFGPSVEVF